MDTGLIQATWGLVAATALLFLASIVPVVRDIRSSRKHRAGAIAGVVPNINILWSRVKGLSENLTEIANSTDSEEFEDFDSNIDEQLEMVADVIERSDQLGLKFLNELYVLRHLLTQIKYLTLGAGLSAGSAEADQVRRHAKAIDDARRNVVAAALTLDAAEALLPKWARNIDGEPFWDRFSRVSNERISDAARRLASESSPVSRRDAS